VLRFPILHFQWPRNSQWMINYFKIVWSGQSHVTPISKFIDKLWDLLSTFSCKVGHVRHLTCWFTTANASHSIVVYAYMFITQSARYCMARGRLWYVIMFAFSLIFLYANKSRYPSLFKYIMHSLCHLKRSVYNIFNNNLQQTFPADCSERYEDPQHANLFAAWVVCISRAVDR